MIMRAPILGLAAACVAFAGSSLYFWNALQGERARAARVEATSRQLNARIAELEKARAEFSALRMAANGTAAGFGAFGPGKPPGGGADAASNAEPQPGIGRLPWTAASPERTAAFQKMMRTQIRANVRRQYADVGTKLGLSKEMAGKLVDLLADQQAAMVPDGNPSQDLAQMGRNYEQKQREQEQAISDLIGPDKALQLKDYQETIPARMETEMLARQLEDNGAPLTDAQRKQLVDVVIEERNRVPMPDYAEGMDQVAYAKSVNEWQDDYEKRVADQAGHFLDSDQLSAYNDIQQWQRDMREQAASAGFASMGAGTRMRRMGPAGGVTFISPAPAFVSASASTSEDQKKP